jgi:hypothetical protein
MATKREQRGPVETATRVDIAGLGTLGGIQGSLAETAYRLARTLDEGAGLATAAVARELRATLLAVREVGDVRNVGADLSAELSTPLDDPADPPEAHARRAGGAGGGDVGHPTDAVAAARRRRRAGS